ncbi:MAG: lamin tail domain-containing protein [Anaerolineae bacterium]|nr:lamin tail domain-containing protein [Anaerolineae bacterium]
MKREFAPLAWVAGALAVCLVAIQATIWAYAPAATYELIINEWSQGNGGSKEWVELLVVSGPQDLRGWSLSDKTPTDLTFSADTLWSNVPSGTLIVVYNGNDRDTILPPDDADLSDFIVVLPSNNATYFSGSWGGLTNTDSADNPQLADDLSQVVHDYSEAPGATAALHPGANQCTVYSGATAAGVANAADWSADVAATACTPGEPNGGANTLWIDGLRGGGSDADLFVAKSAPATVLPGDSLTYQITIGNSGGITATAVILTDTLPVGLSYVSDTSGWPASLPQADTIVWTIGDVLPGTTHNFDLIVSTDPDVSGTLVNHVSGSTTAIEVTTVNNSAMASTIVIEPPNGLIINEIHADPDPVAGDANGDGVVSTSADEFVELVNATGSDLILDGWTLSDSSQLRHTFAAGSVLPDGCALVLFGGGTPTGAFGGALTQTASSGSLSLNNNGDSLTVLDEMGVIVATHTYPDHGDHNQSLTRDPDLNGSDVFVLHTLASGSGGALFSPGTRIDGTPFATDCRRPDLVVTKTGPATAPIDTAFAYTIQVENVGSADATPVIITDTLPVGLNYVSDTSGLPFAQPQPGTLVWQAGDLAPGAAVVFALNVMPDSGLRGTVINQVTATTADEINSDDNSDEHATLLGDALLINAVHYYAYETNDEAVQLINVGAETVNLSGWKVRNGSGTALTFLSGTTIAAGATMWVTKNDTAFTRQFGFSADKDMTTLSGSWPLLANDGGSVTLVDPGNQPVDVVVYGNGNTAITGWSGTAVQPYRGSSFAIAGQILYRMLDQQTGLPRTDTNSAESWAQFDGDHIDGRKVRYPGWDLNQFYQPFSVTESARLTIAVAPDNAFEAVVAAIDSAETSIQMETLIFTNLALMDAMIDAAQRGVAVDILLEGSPSGGILDQERYLCQQLDAVGGKCWFAINETGENIYDRYQFMHAKFIVIDGQKALISSENMTGSSMPYDDKSDGTFGRRGLVLITDAPGVIAHLQTILDVDLDPVNHREILPWTLNHPIYGNEYGAPPVGFIPDDESGGITYTIRYPVPVEFNGTFAFEVVQSPENSVRSADSLIGMVNRAGSGDDVLVQQLNERPYWNSPSTGNSADDPNPRLEAYIDAARRGARVRIMLDEYHLLEFYDPDDPADNSATCDYVNGIALGESLDLECILSNPTGLGIHNKMVLVRADGKGYIHVGSINGTEQSSKGNRELALQVQSDAAFDYLAALFERDWPHVIYLPTVMDQFSGPADHIVISEVLYNPAGNPDDAEFIEVANPTAFPVDLTGYSIGDAVQRDDFEDVRQFPPGTTMPPHSTLVVAIRATAFLAEFGVNPDFEILDSDPAVPDMIDDLDWGDPATYLQLGNSGDEVILRLSDNMVIDAVTYGTGVYPGVVACDLVVASNRSLERFPYWRDTDDCSADFRLDVAPSPNVLPE